jgi:hypothetical protein
MFRWYTLGVVLKCTKPVQLVNIYFQTRMFLVLAYFFVDRFCIFFGFTSESTSVVSPLKL